MTEQARKGATKNEIMTSRCEADRLNAWMEANGYSMRDMADALKLTYHGIYMAVRVRKHITETLKWKFLERFGPDVAVEIFEPAEVEADA